MSDAEINIPYDDAMFYISNLDIPAQLRRRMMDQMKPLTLKPREVDELRQLCTEKLDVSGFGENYELNDLGRQLEAMIDKLFL